MTFSLLITAIERYVHIKGADVNATIKDFINESILDFIRLADWEKLKKEQEITLDGSDSYDLTTFTDKFYSEIELVDASNDAMTKMDYKTYLRASDKTGYYAILGTNIYISGDNTTMTLVYLTTGEDYPLTEDDDEVPATEFYSDVIKKMTVIMLLDYIGDETVKKEEENLGKKLSALKKSENRARSHGKAGFVSRK